MKLLLDENFPKPAVKVLCDEGHDVLWIRKHAPGLSDLAVLRWAARERRVVLTLDKDFRKLFIGSSSAANYGVILFRIHPAVPDKITPIVLKTLGLGLEWIGNVSIVSETAVQMLPLRSF